MTKKLARKPISTQEAETLIAFALGRDKEVNGVVDWPAIVEIAREMLSYGAGGAAGSGCYSARLRS